MRNGVDVSPVISVLSPIAARAARRYAANFTRGPISRQSAKAFPGSPRAKPPFSGLWNGCHKIAAHLEFFTTQGGILSDTIWSSAKVSLGVSRLSVRQPAAAALASFLIR